MGVGERLEAKDEAETRPRGVRERVCDASNRHPTALASSHRAPITIDVSGYLTSLAFAPRLSYAVQPVV